MKIVTCNIYLSLYIYVCIYIYIIYIHYIYIHYMYIYIYISYHYHQITSGRKHLKKVTRFLFQLGSLQRYIQNLYLFYIGEYSMPFVIQYYTYCMKAYTYHCYTMVQYCSNIQNSSGYSFRDWEPVYFPKLNRTYE